MKRLALGLVAAAASLIFFADVSSAVSVGDYPVGAAANGIGGTRHNLGSFGTAITTDATTEICVFCHAPHHGNPDTGPLWNRTNSNSTFTPYGDTVGGTTIGNPGGASLACLSCHDGITTFDTLINAPGKGNGVAGNSKLATDQGWAFKMPTPYVSPHPDFDRFGSNACYICHKEGDINGPVRLTIGTGYGEDPRDLTTDVNLTDDHPVSVPYDSGKASLRAVSTTLSSIDLAEGLATTNDNIAQNRWAVSGSISDSATIGDLLRGGKVECSSCHDPHFKNLSWDETEDLWNHSNSYCSGETCSDGNFLRRVGGNTGSGLCRTCHNK